jgi:putative methionine-R-sulfoxide reductase with GAF domain
MIQAGEAIDASFGVIFSLSTMTAAGFGQCFSDVAGITCGGVVEGIVAKLHLPQHHLTPAQLDLKVTRVWRTIGGCVGVVMGCLLGMSCLLFMDTDRVERAKKAKELQSIFETVMIKSNQLLNAERATLFMMDEEKGELWSRVATGTNGIIKIPKNTGIVGECVSKGQIINIADAYQDDRFNPSVDKKTGFRTRSIICYPIRDSSGKVTGAIEMINKKGNEGTTDAVFTKNDERMLEMLANHVAAFVQVVQGR